MSYKNEDCVKYGDKGSIRFDMVQYDLYGNPIRAWDFKTGSATLTTGRIATMQAKSGFSIPILMIK